MEQYYYSTATLQTYSAYQMQSLFGINTETTAVQILNLNGFYPVQESAPDFDLNLYTTTSVWNLVPITGGQGAILVWSPVAKPLPEAKANGSVEVKQQADGAVSEILTVNYVTGEVIASVASQDLVDRPATLQVILDETTTVTNNLGTQLDAIAAATTVDEINNIVNPPTPPPASTFNVTNNGSGNYVINGASNPTLTLAGGITYTFNISAPGHPFWIKTTQTTGTANIYNTGVTNNGTDNGVITFVVPSTGVPSPLYYNCQYHASMAGVLNMTL